MTTTELVELLKCNERGGATGRSRTLNFYINDTHFIPEPEISICGSGDGLFTDLYINLKTDRNVGVVKESTWEEELYDEMLELWQAQCHECMEVTDAKFPITECYRFCPHCGAAMTNYGKDDSNE